MNSSLVYLVQTDTTVGFSSSNDEKLSKIKQRPKTQKILQTINTFKILKEHTRIPKKYRKIVRNSKNTTFIYPNKESFRKISPNSNFINFVDKFKNIYSTSANLSGEDYEEEFAFSSSDVIVFTNSNFNTSSASSIYKLSKLAIKRLR